MAKYRSTQSGADLHPSQAVRLYATGLNVKDSLHAPNGRLVGGAPFAILSRDEFRDLLDLLNSPASLADGPADA